MKEPEHTITMLVKNQPGVLSRVTGVFSSRGYNIKSLCVAETANPQISRITLTSQADHDFTEKIKKQFDKLVDVIDVSDYTGTSFIQRELMIFGLPVTPENRSEIIKALELFRCRIVTMTPDYFIVEITGHKDETEAVLSFFRPFGIEEMNRTGSIAMRRSKSSEG
jgi:acetolactate synthase-1/3 small subunit